MLEANLPGAKEISTSGLRTCGSSFQVSITKSTFITWYTYSCSPSVLRGSGPHTQTLPGL